MLRLSAHPNPFRPATTLRYTASRDGVVRPTVHDVRGRVVRILANGPVPAGNHEVVWRGRDDRDAPVAAGVYFLRLQTGAEVRSRKIIAVR